MKIFYAINFDETTMLNLKKVQDDLRDKVYRGRWTEPENFHITMHFVGEIEDKELPFFKQALDKSVEGMDAFNLRFTSYGSFRRGLQDLIYVKAKYSGDSMLHISESLRRNAGRGDDIPLKPHITLVRRAEMNHKTLKVVKKQRFNLPPIEIKSIELMESRKIEGKITYFPLYSVSLKR
ncbi:MAG TPA: RNA 2',3'-cyclic phosphodiesterase [Spirochaeta sp.]|nr:RNA 2',3'-cyclic phosphodiesterase [Spirochaeta sp.]